MTTVFWVIGTAVVIAVPLLALALDGIGRFEAEHAARVKEEHQFPAV